MPENYPEDFDARVKVAVYRATAESGNPPSVEVVAAEVEATPAAAKEAYARLRGNRLLLLEADGVTIRMAPPFSGVPTQHRVIVDRVEYYANCAWDALGIPAALHRPGVVRFGEVRLSVHARRKMAWPADCARMVGARVPSKPRCGTPSLW